MKILIVEDEPSLSELIEREVRSEGYVTECARDYITAETKIVGYSYVNCNTILLSFKSDVGVLCGVTFLSISWLRYANDSDYE